VTFDADGQHRAADIAVLIDALARQDADFALGSRFLGTSLNQPLSRRMLLKAATLFTRLTQRPARDDASGCEQHQPSSKSDGPRL
jgi:polyprenyl-phospho-N-acetylgalactosaminyl synthase